MVSIIKMPQSGQNAAESMLVSWFVKEGDYVERGDDLFEIETDKATMNIESFAKGTVLKILHEAGEKVAANDPVAYIGEEGDVLPEENSSDMVSSNEEEYEPILSSKKGKTEPAVTLLNQKEPAGDVYKVIASPKAKAAAKERKVDLGAVFNQLKRAVRYADVLEAYEKTGTLLDREIHREIPSKMRLAIAKKMLESSTQVPQFTVTVSVDMTKLRTLREEINAYLETENLRVSYNDFLAKAVSIASTNYPYIRATYTEEEIIISPYTSVGIAVATDGGLIVPVIHQIEDLTVKEITKISSVLIADAKVGAIKEGQLHGGTITISNLGMYGIDKFTAIINQPESAILAVGGIQEMPVVVEGRVEVHPVMQITGSFDHRLIDGSVGAGFMADLKRILEEPISMLL